uniref:NADH-ubiquinone oxidoreductase chain 1 n=1 Tax=Lithophaga curta TaxID=2590090 RepID=A0A516EZH8_9BIVA|nr:NADH dehydrogenase subunit 1 [Lithophaga curta]
MQSEVSSLVMAVNVLNFILPGVCALVAVGWYTTVERKVLGYIMNRKGPNKVGYMGIMQPMSDGLKLFTKEVIVPSYSNKGPFVVVPVVSFFIALLVWFIYPYSTVEGLFGCSLLYFLVSAGMSMYSVVVAGWASNSKYALLGAVRGVAQSVSFEVVMSLILLSAAFSVGLLSLGYTKMWQSGAMFVMVGLFTPFFFVWLVCILAESNRAPFDFVEGESELVSGYNVEFSAGGFGLLYMTEYSGMLFNSLFSSAVYFGGSDLFVSIISIFFIFFYIWVRGTLPRYRYDLFMMLVWKSYLPLVLGGLFVVMGLISLSVC